jgi:hypothetical protein
VVRWYFWTAHSANFRTDIEDILVDTTQLFKSDIEADLAEKITDVDLAEVLTCIYATNIRFRS